LRRYVDRDALDAIAANARESDRLERAFAEETLRAGGEVVYCAGPGRRTVTLHSLAEWERRDLLSGRRTN
jgi:hypothetical protein